jgi:hypothetical protein
MNTFTAQELADFYQKVADGGEIEKHNEYIVAGPFLDANRLWRIKPAKKVIDMSVLIDSQIDCEFSDEFSTYITIGKLLNISTDLNYPYETGNSADEVYGECIPRMNHKHAWQGGDCPLPEGFMVKVWFRSGRDDVRTIASGNGLNWTHNDLSSDIIAFEVLGLADGYVMPWEGDLCTT